MSVNDEQMQKLAEAEERDRHAAFDLGFAKAAEEAGLTQEQHDALYELGVDLLKQAAEQQA